MKIRTSCLSLFAGLISALLSPGARADWAQSADPLVVQAAPAQGKIQVQNPPSFSWARHSSGAASYEVAISAEGATAPSMTVQVDRNWYLPSKALAAGNYTWRVRPAGSADWSAARAFSISARSSVFEVPDNATLRTRILAKARPRSLPASFVPMSKWNAARMLDLEAYASRMSNEVKLQIGALPNLNDALWPLVIAAPLTAAMNDQQNVIRNRINGASRQLEASTILWRLKADPIYLAEALKRGDQLTSLSPSGPTSFANQDQATRQIALSLVRAADVLAGDLDASRKARWLAAVKARTETIYTDLAGDDGRLDQYPFDSHGNTNLVYLVLISSLSLGDIPEAQTWFDFSFRAYANNPSPWSGPEGGYANGTAYAEYAAGYLVDLWDPLLQSTGVNFYAKPWSLGFLDFAAHFMPPGATRHLFGDGSDTKPDARVFHAFAARMATPRAAWYVNKLGGIQDALALLRAPYPLPVLDAGRLLPPSNSAYFPSIGWAAMHSDISSPGRTSVYFKSSPYGSFSHSHGDQNALLLTVAGQPLLIKAGWYDWFGSPYWTDWYHQTKSQNAVTVDGGQGQLVDGYREQLQRNGKVTSFAAQPTYDFIEGDAQPAYGGKLSMAKRQLWYLRTVNAVLVRDKLAASGRHVFEFNLHAPADIVRDDASSVRIAVNGQSVCVRSLGAGTWEKRVGAPPKPGTYEDHGAFTQANDGSAPAEFLILLDVGCKRPAVSVTTSGSGASLTRTVTIGSQAITLN
ncbi:MAG: heparinase II/III family protein [Massilia sp.]